jgi:hypothetical protein
MRHVGCAHNCAPGGGRNGHGRSSQAGGRDAQAILTVGIAAACASSAAGAVTVNFDSLSSGTTVSDEFVASGAKFVGNFFVGDSTFGGVLVAPSPPNYVAVGAGPPVLFFVDPAKPLRRATTTSFTVVRPQLFAPGCLDGIDVAAYDAGGVFLGGGTLQPVDAQGAPQASTTLAFEGIREVRFIRIETGCTAAFDDLTFAAVVPVDIFSDSFEDAP